MLPVSPFIFRLAVYFFFQDMNIVSLHYMPISMHSAYHILLSLATFNAETCIGSLLCFMSIGCLPNIVFTVMPYFFIQDARLSFLEHYASLPCRMVGLTSLL